jgi:hypothetical protein
VANAIIPMARSLVLCDAATGGPSGKVYLSGVFNAIRAGGFPHTGTRVVVYTQLTGGVGVVPAHIDIRHATRDEVVYHSGRFTLRFSDRLAVRQLSAVLSRCTFPYPGLYTVELFCHNQFVCDTTLRLIEPGGTDGD